MADRRITMKNHNGIDWDNIYPKTSIDQVINLQSILDTKGSSPFVSITSNGVLTNSTSDQSTAIQAILTANKFVYFPAGTYICYDLRPQQGSVYMFHPDCILKFPTTASAAGGGNRQMFLVGFAADTTEGNEFKGFRTIGHPTIDASNLTSGAELEGFHILGAKDVHIDGCTGLNFYNGYVVWAGAPYSDTAQATQALNHNVTIRNIRSINSGFGAVAITAGRNIVVENIYAEGGIYPDGSGGFYPAGAVVVEPWTGNSRECENITIRNVEFKKGTKGFALIIDAHDKVVRNIRAESVYGHIKLSVESANNGLLENLTIEDFVIDGATTTVADGFAITTNNAPIKNLQVRNGLIKNCSQYGVYCGLGDWQNVTVELCGKSGFMSHYTAIQTPHVHTQFYNCNSIDNNTTNTANESGFRMYGMAKVTLMNCRATDTRGTKLQKYGMFAVSTIATLFNTDFTGNATAETLASSATFNIPRLDSSVESRTSDPASPTVGQIWLRTDL